MPRKVAVVPHTHWDREWYAPFEVYRARLLQVVDSLLDTLETDNSFGAFLLDGQVAAVDDYLAERPHARDRLEHLIRSGRISLGPWYALPDEFCVSGETLIRNLQMGMTRSAELGANPAVGYLPDMFGHIAQMPQILRLSGFEHAVVWRGVPSAVDRTAFTWSSPDGSAVRAEYLPVGYANGASLPPDPESLLRRLVAHERELSPFLGPGWPILLMNGRDHGHAQPEIPALLEAANSLQELFRFELTDLPSYLRDAPRHGLSSWTGELRSGARSNLLMGVLSTRVNLKIAASVAERDLERIAEPLCALWLPPDRWPGDVLDQAWLQMVRNSAHDSICGCSVDSVARAVEQRYDSASALASVATADALEMASLAFALPGPVVVNPCPSERTGLVELVLAGPIARLEAAQVLESVPAGIEERLARGADLGRVLGELAADGWLPAEGSATAASVTGGQAGEDFRIELVYDPAAPPNPSVAASMAEAYAFAGAARAEPMTVVVRRQEAHRMLIPVRVPGYGWRAAPSLTEQGTVLPVVTPRETVLSNGLVEVEVDARTGSFRIGDLHGLNRLVDEADLGDTYNFAPGPSGRAAELLAVTVEQLEAGPARARTAVTRRYGQTGSGLSDATIQVRSVIEVHAGDPLVRIESTIDNDASDHRLRAIFPLPVPTDVTEAECAFSLTRRGPAEGGPHEAGLATYPSRRFVRAGGLTLVHEGLLEHELVDEGSALAITLMRCTGVLSRPAPASRPNRAGPPSSVPGAQMRGRQIVRYALALGDVDPWEAADRAWTPLMVVSATGGGTLPAEGSRLEVRGAKVSSLRRWGDQLEIRLFNPSDQTSTVEISGHTGVLTDLLGQTIRNWSDGFAIPPWGVATARLGDPVSAP
jgi:alpha-mannosidase